MTASTTIMFFQNMRANLLRKELVWIALVFLVTLVAAEYYFRHQLEKGINPFFYQSSFEPAVMLACGKGFAIEKINDVDVKVEKNLILSKFLSLESKNFSCADLQKSRI